MKAIFLDRDGVINKTLLKMGKMRAPYSMEEFSFIEGVEEACEELRAAGFLLIVVTNQPDISRGWVSREAVDEVNSLIQTKLSVHEMMVCFHTEIDGCLCRKPKPGMLLEATRKWNIDLNQSFMVGDRMSDVEAGLSAGCRTILVGDGEHDVAAIEAHHRARDLKAALSFILKN